MVSESQNRQRGFFLVPVVSAPKSTRHSQSILDGWTMYIGANSPIPKAMTSSRQRTRSTQRDIQILPSMGDPRPTQDRFVNGYQHRSVATAYS